jgi:hypothetical protein
MATAARVPTAAMLATDLKRMTFSSIPPDPFEDRGEEAKVPALNRR